MSLANESALRNTLSVLGEKIPRGALHPRMLAFLNNSCPAGVLGIACSGGVDSLALLLLLYAHFPEYRSRFVVFHYNHVLRGEASDVDEAFVRDWADRLNLPFYSEKKGQSLKNASEADLRALRHAFFQDQLNSLGGNVLFFGHHQEDVAETMLMRLARGSGSGGLAAPRPVHVFQEGFVHVRPLLNLSKETLKSVFLDLGISWREDASNQGQEYTRNIVRHRILPEFNQLPPGDALRNIARSRQLLEEDDAALHAWLAELITVPKIRGQPMNFSPLKDKPPALYRRALYQWLHLNDLDKHLSARAFDLLLSHVILSKPFQLSAGRDAFIRLEGGVLSLLPKKDDVVDSWEPLALFLDGQVHLPNGSIIASEWVVVSRALFERVNSGSVNSAEEVFIVLDESELPLIVRQWLPGDRYRPLGSPGNKKLQDMFTDKKISPRDRHNVPVVTSQSGKILWVPGFPPAEENKLFRDSHRALRLTYQRF